MELHENIQRIKQMMGVITENSLEDKLKNLSDKELKFLKDFGDDPVLRKFMTSEEINISNKMVKKGLMVKGVSDDKKSNVIYYVDSSIYYKI